MKNWLLAYTQVHLEVLQSALVKGKKRVIFGDKTVEYRSVWMTIG